MTHSSVNFDRSAYQQDVNVCFPFEHLKTLTVSKEIGSVADWHYSFMGSTAPDRMEPAATEISKFLLRDNVNLVLLIPVLPNCTYAQGVLSQYIEGPSEDGWAGISTVQVSLIKPVSEAARPPRALWVPFPFGRPFGPPNRADIQLDVLEETLRLVEQPAAPALIDYSDTTEDAIWTEDGWSCPVTFPGIQPETESDALKAQLHTEFQLLRPWFDEGLRIRGRTTVGITGKSAESIGEMLEIMASFARGVEITVPDGYRQPMPELLRYLAADIRAFYGEAATSKPGAALPNPDDLEQWFFLETVAGNVFFEVRARLLRADLLVLMAQALDDDEIDNRLVLNLGSAADLTRDTLNGPAITRELMQESAK